MDPDFLKKLAELTAALRGGLTANPFDELQKRATQFGEGVGLQMEHDRAQAGYAAAHPQSERAQRERIANAATMALQLGKGEKPILIPAIKTLDGKIVDGITHAHAYMEAGLTEPLPAKLEGYTDPSTSKFYTRQAAEKLMKAWMSPSVKAQMAERSRQAGKDMGMTTEDLNGKLYANRGTKADEPMTLADMERIMAKKNKGKAALDSVVSKLPAALQGKSFKNDVDKRIRGALFEKSLRDERAARESEAAAAQKANATDYNLTKEDRAALRRGDKQRSTGIAQDSVASFAPRLISELKQNGGFTVHPQTGEPVTSGYAVGGGNSAGALLKVPVAELTPERLDRWLQKNRSWFPADAALGGWIDNGTAYIEPSTQVADINAAQRLGNERGEKAIWDHANKSEIPLKLAKEEAAAAHQNEFESVLHKWHSALTDYRDLGKQINDAPERHRAALMNALENPVTPETPWLTKYTQQDIERPNGATPEKVARVESMAYDAFNSPKFKKWLEAGHGTGNWYDTRKTQARAIVALGDKLGPQAFNEFIDHVAASTAMSRPENNIRRASWWRALNLQGMLNPDELRSASLAAPEGMGHIANRAHHFATADLVQHGEVNKLTNPKPASFAENLKMNWRPLTLDTRMANATLTAKPKMTEGLAGVKSDASPRKWAYAPIERAAQEAAAEAAKRGDLDELPAGVDPTAAWQAQVWGGIGRTSKTHMMSANNPSFHDILDRLLKRSAERWGVTPGEANELFWKGQPLDLPLDAKLVTGPSRARKK